MLEGRPAIWIARKVGIKWRGVGKEVERDIVISRVQNLTDLTTGVGPNTVGKVSRALHTDPLTKAPEINAAKKKRHATPSTARFCEERKVNTLSWWGCDWSSFIAGDVAVTVSGDEAF